MFQGDFFARLKTYNITDVSEMLTVPGEMVTFDENGEKPTLEAIGKKLVFKKRKFNNGLFPHQSLVFLLQTLLST